MVNHLLNHHLVGILLIFVQPPREKTLKMLPLRCSFEKSVKGSQIGILKQI